MFSKIVCLYLVILCVFAAPPLDKVPLEKQQPTVIPIISQSEELESNGTYKFSYETANGITREEISYDKVLPKSKSASNKEGNEEDSDESNEIHVQKGSYSYTAPDGSIISVRYIADENGFRPIGDHFPKAPSVAAARSAAKKGRKADLDHEESKSALAQTNSGPKPSASKSQQEAALESDIKSEPLETKFGRPDAPSTENPVESSSEPDLESSNTEGSGSEASTTQVSTSKVSTPVESSSDISTSEPTSEPSSEPTSEASDSSTTEPSVMEPSTTEVSEVSTTEGSTTETSTSESSTSDASTPETSTQEVSSTPESSTTELVTTATDHVTTESSTTTVVESSTDVTSDDVSLSTTTAAAEATTTLASS